MSARWSLGISPRRTSALVLVPADLRLLGWNGGQWQKATILVKVTPHSQVTTDVTKLVTNQKILFAHACCGTCQGDAACVVSGEALVGFPSDCPFQRHRHLLCLLALSLAVPSSNHSSCPSAFELLISFLA